MDLLLVGNDLPKYSKKERKTTSKAFYCNMLSLQKI